VALLVVDAADGRGRRPGRFVEADTAALGAQVKQLPCVIALNKVDLVAKPDLLPLMEAWSHWHGEATVVPIAATTGDGVAPLVDAIAARLPLGAPLYPDDMLTDRSDRFLAAELIREQLYLQLGRELPYACAVQIETWSEAPAGKDGKPGDVSIRAVIVVERESQKAIVVGKGGARIKELGIAARQALTELLGQPVHLALFVKVVDGWSQTEGPLRRLGYQLGPSAEAGSEQRGPRRRS
jgi:GTP-binding protein Era